MTTKPHSALTLEPCPFCGFAGSTYTGLTHVQSLTAALDMQGGVHRIRCAQCRAETGPFATEEAARAAWNTRALTASATERDEVVEAVTGAQWVSSGNAGDTMYVAIRGFEPGQEAKLFHLLSKALDKATAARSLLNRLEGE